MTTSALEEPPRGPVEQVRRRTSGVLLAVAILSVGAAAAFFFVWTRHLGNLERRYFHKQGLGWGEHFRSRLVDDLEDFLENELEIPLPHKFADRFMKGEWLGDQGMVGGNQPRELTLLEGSEPIATIGREVANPESWQIDANTGMRVAVVETDAQTLVHVISDVRSGPVRYRLRCVFAFEPLELVDDTAARVSLVLLGSYLVIVYSILVAAYFLGRREIRMAFRDKEKEIRLRAIGAAAEGIAHEVRNPLNGISLMMQYMERIGERGKLPAPSDIQRVHLELGKIRKVIDNFVGFAKLRDLEMTNWDLGGLVDEVLERHGPTVEELGVAVRVHRDGSLGLRADRPKLSLVAEAVLENAIEATREVEDREISIALEGRGKVVRLAVRDTGLGVDESLLESMFDPFVSTRASAMGLGLTVARTIVESHGGEIRAEAAEGGGCVVTIVLPRSL